MQLISSSLVWSAEDWSKCSTLGDPNTTSEGSTASAPCGGINPYTLTVRLGPGGLAHYETSSRLDLTARSFAQGNKTWKSSSSLVG